MSEHEKIINTLAELFEPLIEAFNPPENFPYFMYNLGWDIEEVIPQPLSDMTPLLERLKNILEEGELPDDVAEFFSEIRLAVKAIGDIRENPGALFPSQELTDQFKQDFPKQLIDYLIASYLLSRLPLIGSLLKTFGLIKIEEIEATTVRPSYFRTSILWGEITALSNNQFAFIKSRYKWGTNDFNNTLLLENFADIFTALGIHPYTVLANTNMNNSLSAGAYEPEKVNPYILRLPFTCDTIFPEQFEIGIGIYSLPKAGSEFPGFAILPYANTETEVEAELFNNLVLKVKGGMDLTAGVGILVRPDQNPELLTDIIPSVDSGDIPPSSGFLELAIQNNNRGEEKMIILGAPDESRFEVGAISIKGGVCIDAVSETDVYVELEINDANIIIKPESGDEDSFLSSLLPENGLSIDFSTVLGFSNRQGFYFGGSAALEITLPLHASLGPITVESVYLSIKVDGRELPVVLAASFSGQIGPVSASVERIGIKFPFSFPEERNGNLGPIDVGSPAFVPPLGAGLAIDAGPVTGGGYVEFDSENERYAGILQLAFGEIGLIAIGLITTRMADGSKGFSMLVIIGVEFDPPISLPYNFNLSGVGGLLGIKRSMNVDYLRDGLKQGTLDSVLFPQDPILNATRIISDLRAGFPPTEDRYIIGPMAIIGWGNPLIIRAEIGIFIEIPSPVRIAILGQITAQLPNAEQDTETIVVIHLDILGVLDFEKKSFSLDATIYDSRILQFALSGDMAMRLYWGDPPFFLTSFGGFNPKFKVQPGTPVLRRMMLSIGNGDNPRLSLACYMALTSNTTQFGAELELTARKAGFKVHGYLYFHALFIFLPFSFVIDMGAGVEVYRGSRCLLCISLDFTLSGPTPWRAKGKAKFKVLFVTVKIRFDKLWGRRQSTSLPATDPWPQLKEALENRGNWKGLLPGEKEQVIRLKRIEDDEGTVAVHPKGRLEISQNVLPFNLTLQKFGNGPIAGDSVYRIGEIQINSEPITNPQDTGQLGYVKDYFAKAQFLEMSDADKLSRPSFEKEDANIIIGSDDISMGSVVKYDLEYETEVIDENKVAHSLEVTPVVWQIGRVLLRGRVKREGSPVTKKYKCSGLEPLVGITDERYRVVTKDDLNSVTELASSYGQAQHLLQDYLESHPEQGANVQIISEYETVA